MNNLANKHWRRSYNIFQPTIELIIVKNQTKKMDAMRVPMKLRLRSIGQSNDRKNAVLSNTNTVFLFLIIIMSRKIDRRPGGDLVSLFNFLLWQSADMIEPIHRYY